MPVLVRPDGSLIQATDEEAPSLRTLGYKDEGQTAFESRTAAAGQEAYYSTPLQKVATGLEGLASGLTLGGSDFLLNKAGAEDFKTRAQYNPGIRLGTEIVGGILPAFVSGGESVPAGALMRGAGLASEASGLGRVGSAVVRGGVEGAGFGLGAEISNASLTGDPLTAESVLAGIGWGAVWGGGLSGLTSGVGAAIENRVAAKRAIIEKLAADTSAHEAIAAERWGAVHGSISDASTQLSKAVDDAAVTVEAGTAKPIHERAAATMQSAVDARTGYMNSLLLPEDAAARRASAASAAAGEGGFSQATKQAIRDEAARYSSVQRIPEDGGFSPAIRAEAKAAGQAGEFSSAIKASSLADHPAPVTRVDVRAAQKSAIKAYSSLIKESTSRKPSWARVEKLTEEFQGHLKGLEEITGIAAPNLVPFTADAAKVAARASTQVNELSAVSKALRGFPVTAEGFVATAPKEAEGLFAAVDTLMSNPAAELSGIKAGVSDAITALNEHLGAGIEGGPGTQLRGLWETLRAADKAGPGVEHAVRGNVPWLTAAKRGAASALAGRAASAAGSIGGTIARQGAYYAVRQLAAGLLGIKGMVVGAVTSSASKWTPKALRLATKAAPRLEPLKTRLDGTVDKGKHDRASLMQARADEVRQAAPNIRDTLYKSISPLGTYHPDLGPAVFDTAVKQFSFLLDKLPRDPGNAFSQLKSLWKPDPAAMEKWARYYRVFQDPVGVAKEMLDSGRVLPEYAEGLREMAPAIYVHMRSEMLFRLSDPAVMAKTSYGDQVSLSLLLDLPLHSSMTARFIAPQQQMYQERDKKLEMPAQPGAPGGGGRPPGPSTSDAQKIGQH